MSDLNLIDELEIESLDDEAIEGIAGGKKASGGDNCCSDHTCSNAPQSTPSAPSTSGG